MAIKQYYAFLDDSRVICLVCAYTEKLIGQVINIEDAYPDGFTCDECNETIL